jgi:hypothetical protein
MALELRKYCTCTILTIKKKLSLNLNRGYRLTYVIYIFTSEYQKIQEILKIF